MTHIVEEMLGMEPVPVKLHDDDLKVIRDAAEFSPVFGSWQTITLQGIASELALGQQILPTDIRRRKSWIRVNPSIGTAAQSEGSVTGPGANAAIATVAIAAMAPGWYTVNWTVELDGTVAAAEQNNFTLKGPSLGGGFVSTNDPAVGRYPQPPVLIYVPPGNGTAVSVRTIGAGTGTAVYSAQIALIPQVFQGGFIRVGTLSQVQNNAGGQLWAGQTAEIKTHERLFMSGDGVTALTVVVYMERDQAP